MKHKYSWKKALSILTSLLQKQVSFPLDYLEKLLFQENILLKKYVLYVQKRILISILKGCIVKMRFIILLLGNDPGKRGCEN